MDKRAEPRISHNVRFFFHVTACRENPELVGLSFESTAIDISKRGMQFKTDVEMPSRTELGITIGIGEPFSMFDLHGTVRWVQPDEDGHCMGVLLEDRENSDYRRWETAFSRLFSV